MRHTIFYINFVVLMMMLLSGCSISQLINHNESDNTNSNHITEKQNTTNVANANLDDAEKIDARKTDSKHHVDDIKVEHIENSQADNAKNASYYNRPKSDAFQNGLLLKIAGKQVMVVTSPAVVTNEEEMVCDNDDCATTLFFDDESIAPAYVSDALDLTLHNLGDLDDDGSDEIGGIPEWWTSVWHAYHVLTFKNGQWMKFIPSPTINLEYYFEHPYVPVEKIKGKKGVVLVRNCDFNDGDVQLSENEVKIP